MNKLIPKEVVDILTLINKQNHQAYLIGGAVRDILIGKVPTDYDLCTNLQLQTLTEQIPHFHLMKKNDRRNAGVTRINDNTIEISEYKGETLNEDIQRRDFAINGIAIDKTGSIIDPFGFQQDIINKKITLIDKTGNSIKENPLLILRAIRLACQLGFEIDNDTKEQIFKHKVSISSIIGQRINIEFSKMLITDQFPRYLEEYFDIFLMIIPELININDTDILKRQKLLSIIPNNLPLKLAALFTYNGNALRDFTQVASRMKLDKKTTKLVLMLLSYKDKKIDTSKNSINRTIHEFNVHNVDLLFAYKKAVIEVNNDHVKNMNKTIELYQQVLDQIISSRVSNIRINTDKLLEMGYNTEESVLIFDDIKARIINCSLQNDERSINSYILKNYKRS